ncbi:MAG: hypothetical protein ACJAT2_003043 [Bacteriovoracaceae bacterium]|jgi:hypothetical protein
MTPATPELILVLFIASLLIGAFSLYKIIKKTKKNSYEYHIAFVTSGLAMLGLGYCYYFLITQ